MKIKINPKYEEMRSFIERIPDVFEKEGRVIYTGRNLIKVMEAPDGTVINVKRYHVPKGPNSLVYSLGIRKPKGERAFEYPMILEKKGIGTPAPIALIEERNAIGLLVSEYAKVRDYNVDEAVDYVMKERAKFWTRYGKKHPIKFKLEL